MQFSLSTQIRFGAGESRRFFDNLPANSVLIYSKSALDGLSSHERLTLAAIDRHVVEGEPSVEAINKILARVETPVHVVGLGGGSAMDAAKAVAACLEKKIRDCAAMLDGPQEDFRQRVHLTLLPTTSGTGSELSRAAILFDHLQGVKRGIRGNLVLADLAVIDPLLTLTCSKKTTAESGFDCLSHATETYLSKKSSALVQSLARSVIEICFEWLPVSVSDPRHEVAREKMAFASSVAGFCLSQASTCLPHRIQYAFSDKWEISHGLGLAMIYPFWLRALAVHSTNLVDLEKSLGGVCYLDLVEKLKVEIGLSQAISSKIRTIDFRISAEQVTGSLSDDPAYSPEVVEKIIDEMNMTYAP